MRFPRLLFCCLPLLALGIPPPARAVRAQGIPSTLQIIRVDASAFPEVRVQILIQGPAGSAFAAPSRGNLSLLENNRLVEYEIVQKELGAEVGFVLDAGTGLVSRGGAGGTRLQEMKDSILALTQDPRLLTGNDQFYILAQEPRGGAILADPQTPATQIPALLARYNPETTYLPAYPLAGVNALLDWSAKEKSAGNGRAQAIVVLSGSMAVDKKNPLTAVAGKARAMGVPVHTVLVRQSLAQQDSLQSLAVETGGRFFHPGSEGTDGLSGLKTLLAGLRTQYILTYRSPNPESGTRIVSAALQYGNSPAMSQYEIEIEPPLPVIRSPGEDQTVKPEQYAPPGGTNATTVVGIIVTASVTWPDGHPRAIRSAALLVNGEPQSVLDSPSEELTFVWSPEDGYPSGPVTLQIRIEDELGLAGAGESIVIRIAEGSALCPAGSASPLCNLTAGGVLPYLSIVIALIAVGLVVVFRKQAAGTAGQAAGAAAEFIQDMGETLRFKNRPASAKAVLADLDGTAGLPRSSIELYGTTSIGRSRKNADLVLQADRADSPISRLHCTILDEDGAFFLRDEQSANGTCLNGMRLAPMERNPLKDGDELQLARSERNGVRLQFRLQRKEESRKAESDCESTNRTDR